MTATLLNTPSTADRVARAQAILDQQIQDPYFDQIAEAEIQYTAALSERGKIAELIETRTLSAAPLAVEAAAQRAQLDHMRADIAEANQEVETAMDALAVRARQLYGQSGVSPRYAAYYTSDMDTTARKLSGFVTPDSQDVIERVPGMKVKRSGPDAEKTRAAAVLAETDPEYQSAAARLKAAIDQRDQRRSAFDEYERSNTAYADYQEHKFRLYGLEKQLERADAEVAKADAHRQDVCARRVSGIPATSTALPLSSARDSQVVRQPDGTVNTWVQTTGDDGSVVYERVVGIQPGAYSMSGRVNALITESGRSVTSSGHYYRGAHGATTDTHDAVIVIAEPAEGSTPLSLEGENPGKGFYGFIDTTD